MSDRDNRLCILLKFESRFDIRCFCKECKSTVLGNIRKLEWKIIRTGLYEEMNNQKIILNKLYDTDFESYYQKACRL